DCDRLAVDVGRLLAPTLSILRSLNGGGGVMRAPTVPARDMVGETSGVGDSGLGGGLRRWVSRRKLGRRRCVALDLYLRMPKTARATRRTPANVVRAMVTLTPTGSPPPPESSSSDLPESRLAPREGSWMEVCVDVAAVPELCVRIDVVSPSELRPIVAVSLFSS